MRCSSIIEITDAQRRKVDYGLDVHLVGASSLALAVSWSYDAPRANEDWIRLTDFDGYDHASTPPMDFRFIYGGESKEITINTLLESLGAISIRVAYRLNSTTASMGVGLSGVSLEDINISGVTTDNIGDYLAAVWFMKNGEIFIANAKDTLNLKTGAAASVDDNVIRLGDFNILQESNWSHLGDNADGFPDDATNCRLIRLHPCINCFTPSRYGEIFGGAGEPTTDSGGNGKYTPAASVAFIGVPDNTPLTIRTYERIPLTADMAELNIAQHQGEQVAHFFYVSLDTPYNTGFTSAGGSVIRFNEASVQLVFLMALRNTENVGLTIEVAGIEDNSGIFPDTSNIHIKRRDESTSAYKKTLHIDGHGYVLVHVRVTYQAGVRNNFTFPTFTAPSYGTFRLYPRFRIYKANDAKTQVFTPKIESGVECRWR